MSRTSTRSKKRLKPWTRRAASAMESDCSFTITKKRTKISACSKWRSFTLTMRSISLMCCSSKYTTPNFRIKSRARNPVTALCSWGYATHSAKYTAISNKNKYSMRTVNGRRSGTTLSSQRKRSNNRTKIWKLLRTWPGMGMIIQCASISIIPTFWMGATDADAEPTSATGTTTASLFQSQWTKSCLRQTTL